MGGAAAGRSGVRLAESRERHTAKYDVHRLDIGLPPELEGQYSRAESVMDGRVTVIEDAELSGLWHYSRRGPIGKFNNDVAPKRGGKFGSGTYLGVGALGGETVEDLKKAGAVRHDVKFTGNLAIVSLSDTQRVYKDALIARGKEVSKLITTIENAPLSDTLTTIGDVDIDAILVQMRSGAELIVPTRSVDNLTIVGRDI